MYFVTCAFIVELKSKMRKERAAHTPRILLEAVARVQIRRRNEEQHDKFRHLA